MLCVIQCILYINFIPSFLKFGKVRLTGHCVSQACTHLPGSSLNDSSVPFVLLCVAVFEELLVASELHRNLLHTLKCHIR